MRPSRYRCFFPVLILSSPNLPPSVYSCVSPPPRPLSLATVATRPTTRKSFRAPRPHNVVRPPLQLDRHRLSTRGIKAVSHSLSRSVGLSVGSPASVSVSLSQSVSRESSFSSLAQQNQGGRGARWERWERSRLSVFLGPSGAAGKRLPVCQFPAFPLRHVAVKLLGHFLWPQRQFPPLWRRNCVWKGEIDQVLSAKNSTRTSAIT